MYTPPLMQHAPTVAPPDRIGYDGERLQLNLRDAPIALASRLPHLVRKVERFVIESGPADSGTHLHRGQTMLSRPRANELLIWSRSGGASKVGSWACTLYSAGRCFLRPKQTQE